MSVRQLLGLATVLTVVSACSEAATINQPMEDGLAFSAHAGNPVVGSATGSGHALCSFPLGTRGIGCSDDPMEDDLKTFTFNAVLRADGSASGQGQLFDRGFLDEGSSAYFDIFCLRIIGDNRAWMMGAVTHFKGPVLDVPDGLAIGRVGVWGVEDNGQGANAAAADRATHTLPIADEDPLLELARSWICDGTDDATLEFFLDLYAFDTDRGNIEVRAPNN